jgi:tRNA threonylcarbamoyladenosine biosynthesis protein TsaB
VLPICAPSYNELNLANTEPRFFLIETSGRVGQIALAESSRIRSARKLDGARKHARDLVPLAAELFAECGWIPKNIDAVVVGRGPGSYTGLRVAIISAKTFAYAAGCKVIGIPTFAAIARQAPQDVSALEVIADAQQDKIYIQNFARSNTAAHVAATAPLAIVPLADWIAQKDDRTWVTGPGLRTYRARLGSRYRYVREELWDPQPATLAAIGFDRYQRGEYDDLWSIEPIYLRPSSAEEKWHETKSRSAGEATGSEGAPGR